MSIQLFALPTIIDTPGQYLTRKGDVVNIEKTSRRNKFHCLGTYPCGIQDGWHHSGRLYCDYSTISQNDIVAKFPQKQIRA